MLTERYQVLRSGVYQISEKCFHLQLKERLKIFCKSSESVSLFKCSCNDCESSCLNFSNIQCWLLSYIWIYNNNKKSLNCNKVLLYSLGPGIRYNVVAMISWTVNQSPSMNLEVIKHVNTLFQNDTFMGQKCIWVPG